MTVTATAPTDPTSTAIHGPAGRYTVVFTGARDTCGAGVISAKGAHLLDDGRYSIGIEISDGYTVANNDCFRRIIEILGWKVDSIDGLLHPDGHTIWL